MPDRTTSATLSRIPTGVPGLDTILNGGLFRGGIYVLSGRPGSGKTILANQLCFHHVREGGRALFATVLAETGARMLSLLSEMSFYDTQRVGNELRYVSAFTEAAERGLAGLLGVLRQAVRDQKASLLVIDGITNAAGFATSELDFKRFIHELQTWGAVMGCTVLIVASAQDTGRPEDTMVDGLLHLEQRLIGARSHRTLYITKFRGSAYLEGLHTYLISGGGVRVYPRTETVLRSPAATTNPGERIPSGVTGLDRMIGGGLPRGSSTLVLGSSGSGKTLIGLEFLAEGARRGEPGLLFGFFETPNALMAKAVRLGLDFGQWAAEGLITLQWQSPAEGLLDVLSARLFALVDEKRIRRVFIDGLVGFKDVETPERLSAYLAVIASNLSERGVTVVWSEETRQLFVDEVEIPTGGVSASFHNILFVRHVEDGGHLRRMISALKIRDSGHDRALHEFEITDGGIRIGEPWEGHGHLMKGDAAGMRSKQRGLLQRKAKKAGRRK